MDLRAVQKPLREQYRKDPVTAVITLKARATQMDVPVACSVDIGRAVYDAQAHAGVGGQGTGACPGDLLLGALAACAQITCQMVAAGLQIPVQRVDVLVEGDLDLRGTLGISREAPVGFNDIRVSFEIEAPEATERQLSSLREKTEEYCVVMQTLNSSPNIRTQWVP